ncbi:MAG: hypothetical protein ACFFB3_09215 [Candidatus Hodarchaeota archaeon]
MNTTRADKSEIEKQTVMDGRCEMSPASALKFNDKSELDFNITPQMNLRSKKAIPECLVCKKPCCTNSYNKPWKKGTIAICGDCFHYFTSRELLDILWELILASIGHKCSVTDFAADFLSTTGVKYEGKRSDSTFWVSEKVSR